MITITITMTVTMMMMMLMTMMMMMMMTMMMMMMMTLMMTMMMVMMVMMMMMHPPFTHFQLVCRGYMLTTHDNDDDDFRSPMFLELPSEYEWRVRCFLLLLLRCGVSGPVNGSHVVHPCLNIENGSMHNAFFFRKKYVTLAT